MREGWGYYLYYYLMDKPPAPLRGVLCLTPFIVRFFDPISGIMAPSTLGGRIHFSRDYSYVVKLNLTPIDYKTRYFESDPYPNLNRRFNKHGLSSSWNVQQRRNEC